jgi:hypothetical protein
MNYKKTKIKELTYSLSHFELTQQCGLAQTGAIFGTSDNCHNEVSKRPIDLLLEENILY